MLQAGTFLIWLRNMLKGALSKTMIWTFRFLYSIFIKTVSQLNVDSFIVDININLWTFNLQESQANTAAQPVGFTAGLKGAEERMLNLRKNGKINEGQAVISVEGFIVEILPDRYQ